MLVAFADYLSTYLIVDMSGSCFMAQQNIHPFVACHFEKLYFFTWSCG